MRAKIIVNADDFGLSKGTNKAIEECYKKGILTSASLFANGPEIDDALKIIKRNPEMGIGIHLSLTVGKCVSKKEQVPLLVDHEGYFKNNYFSLIIKSFLSHRFREQIKIELENQLKKLLLLKVKVDHIDGQAHFQMIPVVGSLINKIAKKYKIRYIRRSVDFFPYSPIFLLTNPPSLINIPKVLLFFVFGIFTPRRTVRSTGMIYSQKISEKVLLEILKNLKNKNGIFEVITHPAYFNVKGNKFDYNKQYIYSFMISKNRQLEKKALLSSKVINYSKSFNLTNFNAIS